MRSARSRTCAVDSSALAYSTRRPARALCAATSSSSVDLPTPGSPLSRIAAPGHDAAAEHAVELADAARAARRVGRVDRRDRPCGAARAGRDRRDRADDADRLGCLDHGAPLLALAAAADPLEGRPPALGAPVRRGGRASGGHGFSVGEARDIPGSHAVRSTRAGACPGVPWDPWDGPTRHPGSSTHRPSACTRRSPIPRRSPCGCRPPA